MEPINKKATVPETSDTAKDVGNAINIANIDDTYLNTESNTLLSSAQSMTDGIGADPANKYTSERDDADILRDDLLTSFIFMLRGLLLWKNAVKQAAANRLMRIVENHGGNFSKVSRNKESGLYDALLTDLGKAEPMADLDTLALSPLVTDMTVAEANYKRLDLLVASEANQKSDYVAPTSIKREVLDKIDAIATYLAAMAKAKPAVYGALAGQVGQLIDTLNQKIRNRGNSKPGENDIPENK